MSDLQQLLIAHQEKVGLCRKRYAKVMEEIPSKYDGKIDKDEEFELLEKFAGRFQRLVEIICNKYFATYFKLYAPKGDDTMSYTFKDYLTFAKQTGLIEDPDLRFDMRNERNRLTHDYLYGELEQLYTRATTRYQNTLLYTCKKITDSAI